MTVKTTGAEWSAFYDDTEFWPDGTWHDDGDVQIDGVVDEFADLTRIKPDSVVKIISGVVYSRDNKELSSLESYFKRWKKQRDSVVIVVLCQKDKQEAVVEAIKAAGGKVQK